MGVSRTDIFSDRQNHLANIFKVLAHPARIAILEYVARQEGCICNDLVAEIGLAQPTISQHLRELKHMGFIKGEVEGKRVCYCIDTEAWREIRQLAETFFENTQNNCCG